MPRPYEICRWKNELSVEIGKLFSTVIKGVFRRKSFGNGLFLRLISKTITRRRHFRFGDCVQSIVLPVEFKFIFKCFTVFFFRYEENRSITTTYFRSDRFRILVIFWTVLNEFRTHARNPFFFLSWQNIFARKFYNKTTTLLYRSVH